GPLTAAAKEVLGSGVTAVAAQRRDRDEVESWLSALARLYVTGTPVQWPCAAAPELSLPTYPFQHQHYWLTAPGSETSTDTLRYQVDWKPVETPTSVGSGRWLIAGHGTAAQRGLTEALRAAGLDCGPVDLPVGADRDTMTDRLTTAGTDSVAGLLSLLALSADADDLLDDTVALLQAATAAGIDAPLWCATSGAVRTGEQDARPDPAQAALWGLGRTAALDLPGRWGGLVDLPETTPAEYASTLAGILGRADDEDQVALRPGGVLARRLLPAGPATPGTWQTSGTVLITGGTGALGGEVARWVARRGAEHVVLASRAGTAAAGATELVEELAGLGTRASVVACDVADREAVTALVRSLGDELRTVVHAAGVGGPTPLDTAEPGDLEAILAAKVRGARYLDEALGDRELDAFVLFSSIAGVWGSGRQAAYGAANAYLDGLAQRRRADGRVATAVAWGPWADGGMATDYEAEDYLRRRGLRPLPPQRAIAALERALAGGDTTVTVADVDWTRFIPAFTSLRPAPLMSDIPGVREALVPAAGPATAALGLRDRLARMPAEQAQRSLLELVREQAAAALGYPAGEPISARRPFTELGFDSLTSIEFRNRLNAATGLSLPAGIVFDFPTPAALAEMLGTELLPDGPADSEEAILRAALAAVPLARFREAGLLPALLDLAGGSGIGPAGSPEGDPDSLDSLDAEALVRLALDGTEA
ncbi:beta-ketoacyl reductase, partial [Rugosimonospora acidiphila]|uniref:beta-ketoacyl reductase n=1 Tax=Rugosimonospora acidiphila TaxID=556531 RepID=UPI0031ECA245